MKLKKMFSLFTSMKVREIYFDIWTDWIHCITKNYFTDLLITLKIEK